MSDYHSTLTISTSVDTQHQVAFEGTSGTAEGYCVPSPSDELSNSSHSILLESPPMDIPTPTTISSNTQNSHSESNISSPEEDNIVQNPEFMSELKAELNGKSKLYYLLLMWAPSASNTASTPRLRFSTRLMNHKSDLNATGVGPVSPKTGFTPSSPGPKKRGFFGIEEANDMRPSKRLMTPKPSIKIRPPSQVRSLGGEKRGTQSIRTGINKSIEGPQITLPSPLFASAPNHNTLEHSNPAKSPINQSDSVPTPEHPICNCHQITESLLLEIQGHLNRLAGLLSHFQA
ncbi:uncharacterized protein MELLADRAFT_69685 [Melampsora larici-populina 98AG31]|uniref:Uncharacterized protein n=1 Tax=Melampsora larici-populina (strain 98AG31 / pathotype 3-4-7) TaxID=747676 RepID=F4SBR4_MELLP|nr:uncharacterized protein MELLADRAFT_69685 [Melampsora larici-populina 98AG31]EGF97921.1 hypothetical protein MELLADRAFT_69685 [Melampsora larici-populina 98AG31]